MCVLDFLAFGVLEWGFGVGRKIVSVLGWVVLCLGGCMVGVFFVFGVEVFFVVVVFGGWEACYFVECYVGSVFG